MVKFLVDECGNKVVLRGVNMGGIYAGAVLFDNYYFKFDNDVATSYYTSNPSSGNYIITTKAYEKLADGCFYNQATASGVVLNNKLEVETKIRNDYVLLVEQGNKLNFN